jgi:hypothetical protein
MSYPKQLLRLRPQGGFISDIPPAEVGDNFFTGCSNVVFRNGFAGRILGSRNAYATALGVAAPGQLMHAINAERAGTNYWLIFESDGTAWYIEGNNATQMDNALLSAVTDPWRHSSALLNGVPIYSNGNDEPVFWGGGNLATLTDWTATESCEFIAVSKFHIFALDISGPGGDFPSLLKWSAAAEPGTIPNSWTPAANNEAGSVELSDSPGALLCAYPLRDALIIYKRSAMYSAQYVGGNNKFQFRKVQSSSGALTRRSVCDINGKHFVISDGDILVTDGTNRQSVGEGRVKDYFFNQLDSDNYLNTFCSYNRAKDEVLIGFPTAGSEFANSALVYDVQRNSFGVRSLPNVVHAPVGYVNDTSPSNTWADRTDTWADAVDKWGSSSVAAATDRVVLIHTDEMVEQDTLDAVAVNASLSKYDMTFGQAERVKFVRRLHIRAAANYGTLLVRVGGKMEPNDATTWSNEVSITDPEQVVNLFAVGRYISVEVRSIDSTVWEITALEIEAEIRGYF